MVTPPSPRVRVALLRPLLLALAAKAVIATLGEGGRYLVINERLWDCDLGEMGYDGSTSHHLSYERYNPYQRRKVLATYGNVTMRLPFNDSYWENTTASIWTSNGWKDNSMNINIPRNACSVLRKMKPNMYNFMIKGLKLPNTTDCFLPARTYHFNGSRVDRAEPRVLPKFPYGLYRGLTTAGIVGRPGLTHCFYYLSRIIEDVRPSTNQTGKATEA